jgi:hypothetical protein
MRMVMDFLFMAGMGMLMGSMLSSMFMVMHMGIAAVDVFVVVLMEMVMAVFIYSSNPV